MEKAVIYFRVSSKEQEEEGYSLDAQEKLGNEYAARRNLEVIKSWKVSESAWKGNKRNAFGQMIEFVKTHPEIKHVIFDTIDRMTRNDFDKMKIYSLIKDYGKTIHLARENKTLNQKSRPDDEFTTDIFVAAAKKLSNDISMKSSMGMQEKAEQGFYPSCAPYGYVNNRDTGNLDIYEPEAAVIRRIFELANFGHSMGAISDRLEREGFRAKKGGKIQKSAIYYWLTNEFYAGKFFWKDRHYDGKYPLIIDKTVFQSVNERFKLRPLITSRTTFPFNNLMTCGECGCSVIGEIKKRKFSYYHCTFSKGRKNHKDRTYISDREIGDLFLPAIKNITLTAEMFDYISKGLKERFEDASDTPEKRARKLLDEKKKLEMRLTLAFEQKADGKLPDAAYDILQGKMMTRLAEIGSEMDSSRNNPANYKAGILTFELLKDLDLRYKAANLEKKARILKAVASNFVMNGKNMSPVWKKPFFYIAKNTQNPRWLPGMDSNHHKMRQRHLYCHCTTGQAISTIFLLHYQTHYIFYPLL